MMVVTEVLDPRTVDLVASYAQVLQVGARNMYNYELLKEIALTGKPVLLKRNFAATINELLFATEYFFAHGNENVILCERGIRTFEQITRNTLDISAIPLLKKLTCLPVVADVSHASGRKDILLPLSAAAFAAGADGIMIEVHHDPSVAKSDSGQQLSLDEFVRFIQALRERVAGV
jgi:3-deoxy-7-phosphoheptulonate synthase/chorismate mutase